MNKAPSLQEWHVNRLESLMDQWEFDDGTDMTEAEALGVLQATRDSGQTMRQMSRMQGNLAEMRETLATWLSKPAVILPAMAVTLAGAAYSLDLQMSAADAEYMLDMAAITQAEYELIAAKAGEHTGRAKEVMTAVLGLGASTAIALNLDRIKKMLTQPGQSLREAGGADPRGERLTQRLSEAERGALRDAMVRFHSVFKDQPGNEQKALLERMVEAISRTERMVAMGESPASSLHDRLEKLNERLKLIENQQITHRPVMSASSPSL